MQKPQSVSPEFLIANYELLLIDAFGVLMDVEGPLAGAVDFIDGLNSSKKPYFILTNGSLFTPEENSKNYQKRGFRIPAENIISSGSLIKNWVAEQNLQGAHFYVLGPESTAQLVKNSGGKLISENEADKADVIVLGHQDGFPFIERMDRVISLIFSAISSGKKLRVLVPNPDLIYPRSKSSYGFTGGALALLTQEAIRLRFPSSPFQLDYIGKPHPALFKEAIRRAKPYSKLVMIGDQLLTDIKGANNAGIDSVLMGSGITDIQFLHSESEMPKYILERF